MTRIIRPNHLGQPITEDVPDNYINTGFILVPVGQQTIRRARRKGRWMAQLEGNGDPLASLALAMDFKNEAYWREGVKYDALASAPGYAHARTANATTFLPNADKNGYSAGYANSAVLIRNGLGLWSCPDNNINWLRNAGSSTGLVTHTTTVNAPYNGTMTLSFIGSGSVTLSGGCDSVTLTGTGASQKVSALVTNVLATTTINVTVTGTVQFAHLAHGDHRYHVAAVQTTGSAVYSGTSRIEADVNPITAEQDFIWWAIADLGNPYNEAITGLSEDWISTTKSASPTWLGRVGNALQANWGGINYLSGLNQPGGGRALVGFRRKNSLGSAFAKLLDANSSSTALTVGSEKTGQFGTQPLGMRFGGDSSYRQPTGYTEFVGIEKGTFTDAQLQAKFGTGIII
jgi:hypothetical protein